MPYVDGLLLLQRDNMHPDWRDAMHCAEMAAFPGGGQLNMRLRLHGDDSLQALYEQLLNEMLQVIFLVYLHFLVWAVISLFMLHSSKLGCYRSQRTYFPWWEHENFLIRLDTNNPGTALCIHFYRDGVLWWFCVAQDCLLSSGRDRCLPKAGIVLLSPWRHNSSFLGAARFSPFQQPVHIIHTTSRYIFWAPCSQSNWRVYL